jgi:hypothetical protein
MLIYRENTLTDKVRNNILSTFWAFHSTVKLTPKIDYHCDQSLNHSNKKNRIKGLRASFRPYSFLCVLEYLSNLNIMAILILIFIFKEKKQ